MSKWMNSRGWWQAEDNTKKYPLPSNKLDEFIHWRTVSENLYLCAELSYNARMRDHRLLETYRDPVTKIAEIPHEIATMRHYAWIVHQVHMLEAMSIEAALKGVLIQDGVISYSSSPKGGKLGSTHDLLLLVGASHFHKKLSKPELELITDLVPYTELGRYPERFKPGSVADIDFVGHWATYTNLHAKLVEYIIVPRHWFK